MTNIRKTRKPPTKLERKLKAKLWTALGSLIIFFSWLAQNFMQDKWQSEVIRLERNKLAISFNEVNKNIYQTFVNSEQSHIAADTNYIGTLDFALTAYVNYALLLQYLGKSISNDDKDFQRRNNLIFENNQKELKEWIRTNQTQKISKFAESLSNWENTYAANTINGYQSSLKTLRDKEEFWNKIYLWLYIIGAICLAYAFIIDYKLAKEEV